MAQRILKERALSDADDKRALRPRVKNATEEFLRAIPKTDIHVHLDGSVRLGTIIQLAQKHGVELPSYEEDELRRLVFKDKYDSLEEYLIPFGLITACMQSADACERCAMEFAEDLFAEGVRYFEVRFAPQLHATVGTFGIRDVIAAVNKGLRRACDEANAKLLASDERVRSGEPYYEYGIIVCAMRMFTAGFSKYYDALVNLHPDESAESITSMASVALVRAALKSRDDDGIPIVALDIAGAEMNHEASIHKEAFEIAHRNFLSKTVHAGEGFGPESIGQAVRDLHAERIGHGFHLFTKEKLTDKNRKDADRYMSRLVKHVSDRRITMEVCLKSNLDTMPSLKLEDHAFGEMLRHRVSVSLNTDNRLVSNTTSVAELQRAIHAFNLSAKQLREIVMTGFKRSFFPASYPERRSYVRSAMDYYDKIAAQFGVE
eukprot:g4343.t1